MSLDKLPAGSRLFIDANVLVYFLLQVEPFSEICQRLFHRISNAEVTAYTSADAAASVIHRAMVTETITSLGIEPRKAVNHLKKHPDAVKSLTRYRTIPSDIAQAGVQIIELTYRELHASKRYRDDYGMMVGDSIILAIMEKQKITHLATNDPDFKTIPGISVWMPR